MKGQAAFQPSRFNLSLVEVPVKYRTERLLNPRKVDDLNDLVPYMAPESKRQWLQSIVDRQRELQNTGTGVATTDRLPNDPDDRILEYVDEEEEGDEAGAEEAGL